MEGQRDEGIEYLVAAIVAAVAGFHANDGDDDFRGHGKLRGSALDQFAVGTIEGNSVIAALVGEEDRPVVLPRLGLGRTRNRIEDALLDLGLGQGGEDIGLVQSIIALQLAGEFDKSGIAGHQRIRSLCPRLRIHRATGHGHTQHEADGDARPHASVQVQIILNHPERHCSVPGNHPATRLRCAWIDINTPKPASSETADVPP